MVLSFSAFNGYGRGVECQGCPLGLHLGIELCGFRPFSFGLKNQTRVNQSCLNAIRFSFDLQKSPNFAKSG